MTENKKKRKVSYVFWIVAAVIIVALVVLVKLMTGGYRGEISETEATVHTGTVEAGDINVTLPGAGTLAAENSSDITVPEGVDVTEWYVSNGDAVSEGDEMAAVDKVSVMTAIVTLQEQIESLDADLEDTADLADGSVTAEVDGEDVDIYAVKYYLLVQQRNELEDEMGQLFKIYEESVITAPCDGMVSGISDSTVTPEAADEDSEEAGDNSTAAESAEDETASTVEAFDMMSTGSYSLSNLSCTAGTAPKIMLLDSVDDGSGSTDGSSDGDGTDNGSSEENTDGSNEENSEDNGEVTEPGEDNSGGNKGSDEKSEDSSSTSSSESGVSYSLAIVESISGSTAHVNYIYGRGSSSVTLPGHISVYKNGSFNSSGSANSVEAGDLLIILYSGKDISSVICMSSGSSEIQSDQASGGSGFDMSALAGQASLSGYDMSAVLGGMSSDQLSAYLDTEEASALTESIASTYSVSESTLASVTPQDTMTITITVDEMDILSIEEGQSAQITLDAFPGRSFDGVVTAVDYTGVNSGGSTKYTAEITIDREEDMLAGMNASAVITLYTENDVLSIPADALIEDGNVTYVYTSYDEKTGDLGGLTEVVTGVSDGENVEITDGLDEGSEFYYSILDVVNY